MLLATKDKVVLRGHPWDHISEDAKARDGGGAIVEWVRTIVLKTILIPCVNLI